MAGLADQEAARETPAGIEEQLRTLWDDPGLASRFPVYVRLTYYELDYGFDWGMLTILDGGLLFQGLRSNFSLTRTNTSVYPWTLSLPRPAPWIELEYKTKIAVKVTFELLPWQADNPYGSPTLSRFRELCEAIREWSTVFPGVGDWEDAVGPPIVPLPSIARSHRERAIFWKGATLLVGFGTTTAFIAASVQAGALALNDGLLLFWAALLYVVGALWFKAGKEGAKARIMADMTKRAGGDAV